MKGTTIVKEFWENFHGFLGKLKILMNFYSTDSNEILTNITTTTVKQHSGLTVPGFSVAVTIFKRLSSFKDSLTTDH